ncbi:MAG: divalent metal cation transporter, partial [Bacteroidetes bacterium]|nr:divalent metal cation transporter [Bacteroidota bacterium]
EWAPMLFAIALIAAGQSSTITGTLAGQVVMEGYLNLRIQPWIRRLMTRLIAIIPAFLTIYIAGESATGKLLVFSQVILSLQLGFAIIPLIHFVSDKNRMGTFAIGRLTKIAAWLCVIVIVGLNINLVIQSIVEWLITSENPTVIAFTIIPLSIFACCLLFYITFKPFLNNIRFSSYKPHSAFHSLKLEPGKNYANIAIAVDFSDMDSKTISHALLQGGTKARYLLIHIVETPGAIIHGKNTRDYESLADRKGLDEYAAQLRALSYKVDVTLGYGNPKKVIPEIVNKSGTELLVMGAHGHRGLKDLFLGTTVDAVRHGIKIPLLVARA